MPHFGRLVLTLFANRTKLIQKYHNRSRTGRKGPYACYYVHCEPGGHCFVGGGLWHPDKDAIAKLRASIDERPHRIRRVLSSPQFRRTFLPKAKDGDDKSIIAAFTAANKENALKTRPQVRCSVRRTNSRP